MQITTLSELVYFPTAAESKGFKEATKEEVQLKLKVYHKVVEFLILDPDFEIVNIEVFALTTDAVAFLLEATSQLSPEVWEEEIDAIIKRIQSFRSEVASDAHKQTTWLLNDLVTNLYTKSIALKSLDAQKNSDQKSHKFYNQLFNSYSCTQKLRNTMKTRGHAIAVGGINNSMIPEWYKNNISKD
ncbi:MAG: hypothetical protein H0U49_09970 [Parachlamydiaceae bacterium]|nr:hypothetical protein [Parachlamydiaceae bacterium]